MEELKLLKHTVKGLNYRYKALKKITELTGTSGSERDFMDDVLGLLLDLFTAEAGSVIKKEAAGFYKVMVFSGDIPVASEDAANSIATIKTTAPTSTTAR